MDNQIFSDTSPNCVVRQFGCLSCDRVSCGLYPPESRTLTKNEWKVLYSAGRMLYRAFTYNDLPLGARSRVDLHEQSRQLVLTASVDMVRKMGYGIQEAIIYYDGVRLSSLSGSDKESLRRKMKYNSKAFDRKMPRRKQTQRIH